MFKNKAENVNLTLEGITYNDEYSNLSFDSNGIAQFDFNTTDSEITFTIHYNMANAYFYTDTVTVSLDSIALTKAYESGGSTNSEFAGYQDGTYTATVTMSSGSIPDENGVSHDTDMFDASFSTEAIMVIKDGVATTTLQLSKDFIIFPGSDLEHTFKDTFGDIHYQTEGGSWILANKVSTTAVIDGISRDAWKFDTITTDSSIPLQVYWIDHGDTLSIDANLSNLTLVEDIADEDTEIVAGNYLVDIDVLQRYNDDDSMCANFIKKDDVPLLIEDGTYTLSLLIARDPEMSGYDYYDTITKLELYTGPAVANGFDGNLSIASNYTDIALTETTAAIQTDEALRAWAFDVSGYDNTFYIKATIGAMNNVPQVFRVIIDPNSIDTPELEVVSISLDQTNVELNIGAEVTLNATTSPLNATVGTDLTWSSSDISVATVDANGTVTAISAGTTSITVTTSNGLTATAVITVTNEIVAPPAVTGSLDYLDNAYYRANIDVFQEYEDIDSMCRNFLPDDIRFSMYDGKAELILYIARNPELNGFIYNDTIGEIEYRDDNGTWRLVEKTLTTAFIDGQMQEAWKFIVPTTNETTYIRAMVGAMNDTNPAFRVILNNIEQIEELYLEPDTPTEVEVEIEVDGLSDAEIEEILQVIEDYIVDNTFILEQRTNEEYTEDCASTLVLIATLTNEVRDVAYKLNDGSYITLNLDLSNLEDIYTLEIPLESIDDKITISVLVPIVE
ncbi:MAG: hypothetical protein BEN19_06450 [Epulopiscium sp. Nuni2H_MBin003]|nr:MAG: hypothetical protein BEN19_06450 [Epulopiscium sp. Nuni2H_MBin003]